MKTQPAVRCMLIRGGTSKGAYFLKSDLPESREERDALLLSIMGSPHPDQIDGIGGGHPLRSKVAIVTKSAEPGVDVDFLFAQVAVDKPLVDTSPNCGNPAELFLTREMLASMASLEPARRSWSTSWTEPDPFAATYYQQAIPVIWSRASGSLVSITVCRWCLSQQRRSTAPATKVSRN
jgi:hypothetical protein